MILLERFRPREKDSLGRTVNQSWATNKTIKKDWVSPLISALPERAAFLLPKSKFFYKGWAITLSKRSASKGPCEVFFLLRD